MKWSLSSLGKKNAGFTLIELLVVIAIIAILSTIGLSAFTSAQQRARDAKRRGDLKSVQDAAEQYYIANDNKYSGSATCDHSQLVQGAVTTKFLQNGMPVDPKTGSAYTCTNSSTSSYCLCATMEGGATSGNSAAGCVYSSGNAGGPMFCISNKQ